MDIDKIGFILYRIGARCCNAKFEVEFYETPNGDQPAKEFLLSLDK